MTHDFEGPMYRPLMMPRPRHKPPLWGRRARPRTPRQNVELYLGILQEAGIQPTSEEMLLIYECYGVR